MVKHSVLEVGGMRVAHVLRKYDPVEWGGTETAVHRLFLGLREYHVESVVYCPRLQMSPASDPLTEAGCTVKRFRAFLPIAGISELRRRQHIAIGGNLMSLHLPLMLWSDPGISVIHSHTLGRLGAIAAYIARKRGAPFVITIHGGYLDLPPALKESFQEANCGWEWGKVFGFLLRSRQLIRTADAILTCNSKEAALLQSALPGRRVMVQPHGISMARYRKDSRERAWEAFPRIRGRDMLLCAGRIDPVKNQHWLVEAATRVVGRHPNVLLVFAGACTDEGYGESLRAKVIEAGLDDHVLFAGGLPPDDARLVGLFQQAKAVLLPSVSETFGLVILEAWAAGAAVIASRTSGASALIRHGRNGWLFDHNSESGFLEAVDAALLRPEIAAQYAAEGNRLVGAEFDSVMLAGRIKQLYEQLLEEKHALRYSSRRRH